MLNKLKKIVIIFLIIAIIIYIITKIIDVTMKRLYPLEYSETVYKYAEKYEVDPLLIFSIIKAESNFRHDGVSTSNAIGLMQLMETTAEELADKLGINYTDETILYNPDINIQLGTKYISELIKQYNGNYILAVAAYNAGPGNVAKWIENGQIKEDGSDVENIPFKETNNYVRKIVRNYRIYQKIY